MQLNPYLNFNGQCEEAFRFYEKCLGGTILAMMSHEGSPMEGQVPAEWRNKIMHARMSVGNDLLMGSDSPPSHYQQPQGFSVTVNIAEPADAERVFRALADGGKVHMPLQETFWAKRFGTLVDRFGIPWMVNCEKQP